MPRLRPKLITLTLTLLLLSNWSCKSRAQRVAEEYAQAWYDQQVARCGDDCYARYTEKSAEVDGGLIMGEELWSLSKDAVIEFKCVGPKLVETPLTQSDKLNGIGWKGNVSLPLDSSFRYYDYKRKAWSLWSEYHIVYAPTAGRLLAKAFLPSLSSSPQTMDFAVENGKADHIVNAGVFSRPACSEIPPD